MNLLNKKIVIFILVILSEWPYILDSPQGTDNFQAGLRLAR